jgi:hydroxyacylglutathione hydrolase
MLAMGLSGHHSTPDRNKPPTAWRVPGNNLFVCRKPAMSPPRIVKISILPLGLVNCHLVIAPEGCILVDTGLPGSEHKIGRALKRHGRSFSDVTLIVVTHAHVDHAGSAARLRELTGAPILAHAGDLDHYQQRKPMTFCETGWFGRLFMRTGLILQPYASFTPDILLCDTTRVDLSSYGIDGVAFQTPGHTTGSVSIQLGSGDALVGDLVASGILLGGLVRTEHAMRPPFEDDPQMVSTQLMGMVEAGMQRFHMGHGGPLIAGEVRRHALSLRGLQPGRQVGLKGPCACAGEREA